MLSDSCFDFRKSLERGLEYNSVFREIGTLRGEIEHYGDPNWDYEPEVINELRVATANAFGRKENALVELLHLTTTVAWHYCVFPGCPELRMSWEEFKACAKGMCLHAVSRTRHSVARLEGSSYIASESIVERYDPSKDIIRAQLNDKAVAQLRRQLVAHTKTSRTRVRTHGKVTVLGKRVSTASAGA